MACTLEALKPLPALLSPLQIITIYQAPLSTWGGVGSGQAPKQAPIASMAAYGRPWSHMGQKSGDYRCLHPRHLNIFACFFIVTIECKPH